ncbi:MAG: nucleotide pyrophosphohydrolase [Bacilli bacterium]|nr:nucleotide pyrophosphohydrolase [Bacilli bacterium]
MSKQETKNQILKFRDDRDWLKYHNGKDLSISISLEANELLEIFQWSGKDLDRVDRLDRIKDELADIFIYCYMMADYYHLDVDEIISNKLKKNLNKYPDGKMINLTTKDD